MTPRDKGLLVEYVVRDLRRRTADSFCLVAGRF